MKYREVIECRVYASKGSIEPLENEKVKVVIESKDVVAPEVIIVGEYGFEGYLEAKWEIFLLEAFINGVTYEGYISENKKKNNSFGIVLNKKI